MNLRQTLHAWREKEAAQKGVELFRVLPNSAIDEIVRAMPKTKEELTAIKGIKDAKFHQYGAAILNMVSEAGGVPSKVSAPETMTSISYIADGVVLAKPKEERTLYSVSTYLDIVNRELWRMRATVKGEVTSFKEQGKAVYFSLRDGEDGSVLSAFMWVSDFALAGIQLAEGLEVILEGRSEIYKPTGRLSFRAETIELVGEGAFQKAYNDLKKKLDAEGVFAPEKKRALKEHPMRIGLVTSRSGAVIHDFLNNLGRFGYQVFFVDSRVEGASAVKDILSALTLLESKELDALVLIRGGGSLESLQAFNNEHVVRKIATFPAATICAIGHDRDVPLAQLAADYAPSTPTATTVLLNASWEKTTHELALLSREIFSRYGEDLWRTDESLRKTSSMLGEYFEVLVRPLRQLIANFNDAIVLLARSLSVQNDQLRYTQKTLIEKYTQGLRGLRDVLRVAASSIGQNDPMRQLRLGYSILRKDGRLIRSVGDVAMGDHFEAKLADGTLVSEVIDTHLTGDKER